MLRTSHLLWLHDAHVNFVFISDVSFYSRYSICVGFARVPLRLLFGCTRLRLVVVVAAFFVWFVAVKCTHYCLPPKALFIHSVSVPNSCVNAFFAPALAAMFWQAR